MMKIYDASLSVWCLMKLMYQFTDYFNQENDLFQSCDIHIMSYNWQHLFEIELEFDVRSWEDDKNKFPFSEIHSAPFGNFGPSFWFKKHE